MTKALESSFNSILSLPNDIPGINGVLITNHTQKILARKWSDTQFQIEQVTALTKEILETINNFSEESCLGKFSSIHQEGTFGQIYISRWLQQNLFIILMGSSMMNIGMARIKLESILQSASV